MPQYLYLLYTPDNGDDRQTTAEEWAEMKRAHDGFTAAVEAADGASVVAGDALESVRQAKTLTAREGGGDPLVTDGPFAETKEVLGGYYLMECRDAEQALQLAKQCPNYGSLEVRPTFVVPA